MQIKLYYEMLQEMIRICKNWLEARLIKNED